MDKTAEEILDQHLYNKFDEVDRVTFILAMKAYAENERRKAFENARKCSIPEGQTGDNVYVCYEYGNVEDYLAKNPLL